MQKTIEQVCPSLCLFLQKKGDRVPNNDLKPSQGVKLSWEKRPYRVLLAVYDLIEDYAGATNIDDAEKIYATGFMVIYTKLLDAITLKPSAGFLGFSNNSAKENKRNYYNRKVLNTIRRGFETLNSVHFSEEEKMWLDKCATNFQFKKDELGKTIKDIENRKGNLLSEGFEAAKWLIVHFDENQSFFHRFLEATIEDLKFNKVELVNLKKFYYRDFKKNINYRKIDTWIDNN